MTNITKKALEASLKKMMLKKPLDKITIRDITDDCGISRMTFYYHFQDIYDLIEWACVEDATAALQGKKTYDTWHEGLVQIFEAVLENKAFILNAYRCISREQMENFLFSVTYGLIRGVVDEKKRRHQPDREGKGLYRGVLQIRLCGGDAGLDPARDEGRLPGAGPRHRADHAGQHRQRHPQLSGKITPYKSGPMNSFCSPGRFCAWRRRARRGKLGA